MAKKNTAEQAKVRETLTNIIEQFEGNKIFAGKGAGADAKKNRKLQNDLTQTYKDALKAVDDGDYTKAKEHADAAVKVVVSRGGVIPVQQVGAHGDTATFLYSGDGAQANHVGTLNIAAMVGSLSEKKDKDKDGTPPTGKEDKGGAAGKEAPKAKTGKDGYITVDGKIFGRAQKSADSKGDPTPWSVEIYRGREREHVRGRTRQEAVDEALKQYASTPVLYQGHKGLGIGLLKSDAPSRRDGDSDTVVAERRPRKSDKFTDSPIKQEDYKKLLESIADANSNKAQEKTQKKQERVQRASVKRHTDNMREKPTGARASSSRGGRGRKSMSPRL